MSPLFEPEYGAERAQEGNAFDSGKCNHMYGEIGVGGVAPCESPVGFGLNTWYCFDGMKQAQFLFWILDVRVNEEGVHFAVDVFDCNLEAIEAPGFGGRDFGDEVAAQVLIDDPIRGSKECKDMGDEVAFGVGQSDPVREVY